MILDLIQNPVITTFGILLFIAGLIFSISFHEFSHAKSAQLMGDKTPEYQGRVTLNPLAHLEPVGLLALLVFPFGWGKPVQVNPDNMGLYPERKYFISSIVGPLSNIFLCFVIFLITWVYTIIFSSNNFGINRSDLSSIYIVFQLLFSLNLTLAFFNLIPIPPLDGSKIWPIILPSNIREKVEPFIFKYGIFLLLLLVFPIIPSGNGTTSLVNILISPGINFITDNVFHFFLI